MTTWGSLYSSLHSCICAKTSLINFLKTDYSTGPGGPGKGAKWGRQNQSGALRRLTQQLGRTEGGEADKKLKERLEEEEKPNEDRAMEMDGRPL